MARPIWKGHISFGLVNIPVTLHSAEQRTDLQFHMLDSRDNSRIRYERVNAETGEEVPWNEIVRGYEYSEGNFVVVGDEELKRAAPEATRSIDIEGFVGLGDIPFIYFDKPYYVAPASGGEKGYALLREVLKATERVGIARVVIRTRQYIAALIPMRDVLVLNLLRYDQELRPVSDLALPKAGSKAAGVSPAELKAARVLIETMSSEWDPKAYHDEYRDTLRKWIEKKAAAGGALPAPEEPEEEEAPTPINFMELLQKSLEQAGGKSSKQSGGARSKKVTRRKKAG